MRKIKNAFTSIVGNDKLKNKLVSDISCEKLSHAYLIEGKKGSGRHTIAYMIAAALSCENKHEEKYPLPCMHCPSCRKILERKSPDIIIIDKEDGKATLGVDQIRFLRTDVRVMPNELDYKFYIIENANDMTDAAQNALLLTLEDPPEYIKFFLICEDSSSLLETIRSRAQIMRTSPVAVEYIDKYLCENIDSARRMKLSEPQKYKDLLMSAENSIGHAIELLDSKALRKATDNRELTAEFINAVAYDIGSERITYLIAKFDTRREGTSEQIQTIMTALRDLILLKKGENVTLGFYYDKNEALLISDSISIKRLINIYDSLTHTLEQISANSNIRLTLINLFSQINLL